LKKHRKLDSLSPQKWIEPAWSAGSRHKGLDDVDDDYMDDVIAEDCELR
jgi:hypothetical protein